MDDFTLDLTADLSNVKLTRGVAGTMTVAADVTYKGEPTVPIAFQGSTYGGPVVMITSAGQNFVTDPGRFGDFSADPKAWLHRFFA